MRTLLTVVLVVGGLLALPLSPWTGIVLMVLGYFASRRAWVDEGVFVGVLGVLAFIGAVAMVVQDLWVSFIALP